MAESAPVAPEVLFCTVHPSVETSLRCNKCGRPMCIKCARRTPVGYRCKECVSNQQAIFFNAQPLDPVIQVAVSAILSAIAGGIIGFIGGSLGFFLLFLVTLPASTFAGGLIADIAHRAVGKRYGKYGWLAVGAGIVLGALMVGAIPFLFRALAIFSALTNPQVDGGSAGMFLLSSMFTSIGWWVYVVVATGAGVARLRMGK